MPSTTLDLYRDSHTLFIVIVHALSTQILLDIVERSNPFILDLLSNIFRLRQHKGSQGLLVLWNRYP